MGLLVIGVVPRRPKILRAHGEARYGERKAIEAGDWEGPNY